MSPNASGTEFAQKSFINPRKTKRLCVFSMTVWWQAPKNNNLSYAKTRANVFSHDSVPPLFLVGMLPLSALDPPPLRSSPQPGKMRKRMQTQIKHK